MQKQKRLIYAEEFERALKNDTDFAIYEKGRNGDDELFIPISDVIGLLEQQPTIEAEPVKHGKWIKHDWRVKCSECGGSGSIHDTPINPFNYCPNCGARMDGE